MLEKREYLMLKYLRSEHTGAEIAVKFGPNAVQTATDLAEAGMVHQFNGSDASFLIASAGTNAMQDYKTARKQRLVSVWVAPIVIAIIGACIALVSQLV